MSHTHPNFDDASTFDTLPKTAQEALGWSAEQYRPYFQVLTEYPITPDNVAEWLADWTRLSELASEVFQRLHLASNQNTADQRAEKRYSAFSENVFPAVERGNQQLKKKLLDSRLAPGGFEIPLRKMRVEAELFREENLPLLTEERRLVTEFEKITGAQTVEWEGKEVTVSRLQPIGQSPDRTAREHAWRVAHRRFLADRGKVNALWGKFLDLRTRIASNAGFRSYTEYRWKAMGRFDYTPADCARFHRSIEEAVVPAANRLYEEHRKQLGVETLRPWDLNVDPTHPASIVLDPMNRAPLHPYQTLEDMENKAASIFNHLDPVLGGYFETMRREDLLDLGNRKDKAPGGYTTEFQAQRRPFIFMNAVGLQDDFQTLMHESGHAFQTFEGAQLKYVQELDTPIEFAEVASLAMELLTGACLPRAKGGLYSDADAARARISVLEGFITFWPYMAVVDAFQLWAYGNVEAAHDPAQCDSKWAELWKRFMRGIDWSGLDQELMTGWHRKLHIHTYPLYYVEYGMAQLGAVQVWARSLKDQAGAVVSYRKALALGGTVPLPKLYETAGAEFSFDADTLRTAVNLIERTIEELSAVH